MVLLASELVGPYAGRITTFLGYIPGLVQVIPSRLHGTQVICEAKMRADVGLPDNPKKSLRRWAQKFTVPLNCS